MLKLECQSCGQWVHSPFLAELEETQCPNCAASIKVKDICISAGTFSMYRDVLLKHMFKYQRLLSEAEREIDDIKKDTKGKASTASIESVKMFVTNLREMLEGCRDSFRVNIKDISSEVSLGDEKVSGHLVNISTTGVCIDAGQVKPAMKKGDHVEITIGEDWRGLNGKVVWVGKGNQMGIRFLKMDSETKNRLLEFIKKT